MLAGARPQSGTDVNYRDRADSPFGSSFLPDYDEVGGDEDHDGDADHRPTLAGRRSGQYGARLPRPGGRGVARGFLDRDEPRGRRDRTRTGGPRHPEG